MTTGQTPASLTETTTADHILYPGLARTGTSVSELRLRAKTALVPGDVAAIKVVTADVSTGRAPKGTSANTMMNQRYDTEAARRFLDDRLEWSCMTLPAAVRPGSPGLDALLALGQAVLDDSPQRANDALARVIRLATVGLRPQPLAVAVELLFAIPARSALSAWPHHARMLAPDPLQALVSASRTAELMEMVSGYVLSGFLRYFAPNDSPDDRFAALLGEASRAFPLPDGVCLTESLIRFLDSPGASQRPWLPATTRAAYRMVGHFGRDRVETRAGELAELRRSSRLPAFRNLAAAAAAYVHPRSQIAGSESHPDQPLLTGR